jgi:hypothetical protein
MFCAFINFVIASHQELLRRGNLSCLIKNEFAFMVRITMKRLPRLQPFIAQRAGWLAMTAAKNQITIFFKKYDAVILFVL